MRIRIFWAVVLASLPSPVAAKPPSFAASLDEGTTFTSTALPMKLFLEQCKIPENEYPDLFWINAMLANHDRMIGPSNYLLLFEREKFVTGYELARKFKTKENLEKACSRVRISPSVFIPTVKSVVENMNKAHLAAGHVSLDDPDYALAASHVLADRAKSAEEAARRFRESETNRETSEETETRVADAAVKLREGVAGLLGLSKRVLTVGLIKPIAAMLDTGEIAEAEARRKSEEEPKNTCEAIHGYSNHSVVKDGIANSNPNRPNSVQVIGKSVTAAQKPGSTSMSKVMAIGQAAQAILPLLVAGAVKC